MTKSNDRISGTDTAPRDSRGRFGPGNPGKRRGARNKATIAALKLLEGESKQLMRKAIDLALAGDSTALRLCLERVSPPSRERVLAIDLPVPTSPADVPKTLQAILQGAADGTLTSGEAERLSRCVQTFSMAFEAADFDARLRALEGDRAK
ncbi:hypothetical protein [Xanthomonas medicagonis]|uniref:hypothetical protein n=1 Tax=Xanthomonas medicagonis TaxID=3160841 RepID=UPI003511402D